jgi:hypothetical protein
MEASSAGTDTADSVPSFSFVPMDHIREVESSSNWRKAIFVDGELRWTDNSGTEIGDLVQGRGWKMRNFGNYMLLAPLDNEDESKEKEKDEGINKPTADFATSSLSGIQPEKSSGNGRVYVFYICTPHDRY